MIIRIYSQQNQVLSGMLTMGIGLRVPMPRRYR